jgi:predicted lipoprotein with Yx(FWY)xxD motif
MNSLPVRRVAPAGVETHIALSGEDLLVSARYIGGGLLVAAALILSACGADQSGGSTGGGTANGPVGTKDVPGVGTVLVDTAGKTLYFTDSDQSGAIKCVADCTQLWQPAKAPDNVLGTNLGMVARPDDGTNQLTYQGHPIYTFSLDSQDKPVSGNNTTDSFGGVDFTWHAVIVSATDAPAPTGDGGGGGY